VTARALARELGHGQIGTQHLLLALLEVRGSVAARALRAAGLKAQGLRAEVTRHAGEGVGGPVAESLLPFTDESKTALERALRESLARGQAQIGTENILMGLLEEPRAAAFQALTALHIDIAQLRSQFEQKPPLPGYRPGRMR
jgi:ATP-dependent Clp protease ATP-binding subunit ClpC